MIFRKKLFFLVSIFLFLFFIRFVYTFFETSSNRNLTSLADSFQIGKRNYASEKKVSTESFVNKSEQKYEKIGTIHSSSNEFDKSESEIRNLIKNTKSIIQFENNSGLVGKRSLQLGIGVEPDKFDSVILEIKKVGELESISINKTDKTSEFGNLQAKKNSLFKTRESLNSLKKISNSKVDELINLENKILEIEESIQKLGLDLGQFNLENEFCTIKFSLVERKENSSNSILSIFVKKVVISFEWTVKFYLGLMFAFFFGFISLFLTIKILEKFSFTKEFLDIPNCKVKFPFKK